MSKKQELYLGAGNHLDIKASELVSLNQSLTLITPKDGAINLNIKVEADFDTIPEVYHEVFLNMMTSKYLGTTSFSDNPFSQCMIEVKKRWYQFWKK